MPEPKPGQACRSTTPGTNMCASIVSNPLLHQPISRPTLDGLPSRALLFERTCCIVVQPATSTIGQVQIRPRKNPSQLPAAPRTAITSRACSRRYRTLRYLTNALGSGAHFQCRKVRHPRNRLCYCTRTMHRGMRPGCQSEQRMQSCGSLCGPHKLDPHPVPQDYQNQPQTAPFRT